MARAVPFLRALWHRPAGPMNWKNPIRVLAVAGWSVFQTLVLLVWAGWRVVRFIAGLPAPVIFIFAGLWVAVWHFVRRPFPALGENPLLDLMDYHTPAFYGWVMAVVLRRAFRHRHARGSFCRDHLEGLV